MESMGVRGNTSKAQWTRRIPKTGFCRATRCLYKSRRSWRPEKDAGSTFEMSFKGSRIEGKVNEPHDPPLVGAAFDRVPREGESYVKDFRPLPLGTFRLERGRGELALRALQIPGGQVMDVRAITLTLK